MAGLSQLLLALQAATAAAVGGIVVGNRETVTLGGTPRVGDVVTLTLTSAGITGSPVAVAYTVVAGDGLMQVAAALARAIANQPGLRAAKVQASPSSVAPTLAAYWPTALAIAWAFTLSPGATETVALAQAAIGPRTAVGFPDVGTLQAVARGDGPLLSVYDRKVGRNTTRWSSAPVSTTITPATLTSSAPGTIPPLGASSLTLAGAPTAGDAVSAVLTDGGLSPPVQAAAVAVAVAGDTAATMATKLAAAINADPGCAVMVSAAPSGAAVVLTSRIVSVPLGLFTATANGGTQVREVGRRERQVQVIVWARTADDRAALSGALESAFGALDVAFGLTLPDGTAARVTYGNDFDLEDDTLEDVYRHDFLLAADYPVTTVDQLYAVVAPVAAYQFALET